MTLLDWRYEARICGNLMVTEEGIPKAAEVVIQEGCSNPIVVDLDGAFLVYGTKVERAVSYRTRMRPWVSRP